MIIWRVKVKVNFSFKMEINLPEMFWSINQLNLDPGIPLRQMQTFRAIVQVIICALQKELQKTSFPVAKLTVMVTGNNRNTT